MLNELTALLSVAGERRPLYLTAIYTGLRRNELEQLQWGDVHLDTTPPYIEARASTTKNKERALIPLHRDVADTLVQLRPDGVSGGEQVFGRIFANMYQLREFKQDLKKAGVAFTDGQGRKADFHALRHTLATNLARNGVAPRTAMAVLRHSDMKLTQQVYTDASQLPTTSAIQDLPSFKNNPLDSPQTPDSSSHSMSRQVTHKEGRNTGEVPGNKDFCHALAPTGTDGRIFKMAERAGLTRSDPSELGPSDLSLRDIPPSASQALVVELRSNPASAPLA